MKLTLVLLGLVGLLTYAEAIIVLGTAVGSTVAVGTALNAAALAGVGGLALGAGLVGFAALAGRRGKRSVQDSAKEETIFNLVSSSDSYGCALKLVCLLEAKPEEQLTADDQFILTIFGREPEAPTVEALKSARGAYDYAAFMGSKFGADACQKLFHTCSFEYEDMIAYVAQLRA
ncbi:uncharacterized protein LOC119101635 [Pollicipes pollicipes]|uniref:uncharacterized protein LOC119101554 n=1 Tax=Pollicipes pollicipes TaxID=41117 RepID=UPI0018854A91|nr:uncharacterized protein LOC119101554 [Pollicipes pollicipes]XP_037080933.1 uncharacterized protein LOC119101635 [Pollicipes pollicipes]